MSQHVEPIWSPLAAPEGYEFEMDISRPGGALRYRLLPKGQWIAGPLPSQQAPKSAAPSQGSETR